MDSQHERLRAEAEAIRQQQEVARQASERDRDTAEEERVAAEQARRAAASEVGGTVATLTDLVKRMEAVEALRRAARTGTDTQ
jgi:hypothetical protein